MSMTIGTLNFQLCVSFDMWILKNLKFNGLNMKLKNLGTKSNTNLKI